MNTSERYRERNFRSEKRIREAFQFKNQESPYIIYDVNYWLFGALQEEIPEGYCSEDPSIMTNYQAQKIEIHMREYQDVYIPFLMPWFGTGVLASGFGIDVKFLDKMDPAVDLPTIQDIQQVRDLKKPNPLKDGLMPRVLNTIRYMRENTDFPVGVTDCQGPLTTALQIIGYDKMIYWMHDHPEMIHDLMQLVTDSLIEWIRVQKEIAGQSRDDDAYVLGVKIPGGIGGVWISDDDSVIFGKDLYREFVVPYNSQVLEAFGGGVIHFCGSANQHIENFLSTRGLKAIHNLNLDHLDEAARLCHALAEKKLVYMVGDFNLEDNRIDHYYQQLFQKMNSQGLIVISYIAPALSLQEGQYIDTRRDPGIGKRIEQSIQKHNHLK